MKPEEGATARQRFEVLFAKHQGAVLAYAMRRCATLADAEDATAETFTVAWRRLTDVPSDPLPWLYGVCRRIIANQHRSGLRRIALRLRIAQERPVGDPGFGEAEGPATAALRLLRTDDQEILRLVAWEQLRHGQIASALGITPNAVAIRLHRARQRFVRALAAIEPGLKGSSASRTSIPAKGRMPGRPNEEDAT